MPVLAQILPLFELKKFSVSKLNFDPEAMIDTLIRYKEKGSYAGQKSNNPEVVIEELLADMGIDYTRGDLPKLKQHDQADKRMMDFIIPNRDDPQVIIESSYMTTTSSGQGDKSKVELSMRRLIKNTIRRHTSGVLLMASAGMYVRTIYIAWLRPMKMFSRSMTMRSCGFARRWKRSCQGTDIMKSTAIVDKKHKNHTRRLPQGNAADSL